MQLVFSPQKRYTYSTMIGKNYTMKNQSPENGAPLVPDHLRPALEVLSKELREASEQLHEVQQRHRQAILARIALQEQSQEISADMRAEWESLIEELQVANHRYHQATVDRIAFVAEMNGETH